MPKDHTRRARSNSTGTAGRLAERLESRRLLSVNVLTWHDDLARTGLNSSETQLTPANVNQNSFGKLFSYAVDGKVYAQPLYVSNLAIPGQGTHDVLLVATEKDQVYAFDADSNSGANGGLLWHVSLGTPAAMPNNYFGNRYGPYHDLTPFVGITGTPVIDLSTNTMYVDAFTNDSTGVYSHHIHALDITTGRDKVTPVLVQATYPGDGVEGDGTTLTFLATQQLQRPALTLLNGTVYVAYGSYADTDPYHGWVLGFDSSSLQLKSVFNTTPNSVDPTDPNRGEGAIWQAGAGLASDGSSLYFMTGNGDFDTNLDANGFPTLQDYGDSFVKLSTANSTLTVSDYFTPSNQASLSASDADLGSGGVMLLPDSVGSAAHPHLMVGSGKQGLAYLIDRDSLGKFDPNTDNVVQEIGVGGGTWSSPAYFNGNIYFRGGGGPLEEFSISNAHMTEVAHSSGSYANEGGATPSVSANGTTNGIVWDVQGGGATDTTAPAILHAFDAVTLTELYTSAQAGTRDQIGLFSKFVTPTIADGKVFVGAVNTVAVFGLLPPPTQPPAAPSSLTATAIGPRQVSLKWVDNSNNESGFKIERSTDGVNFVQIALTQSNVTSYLDTTASPNTQYFYRVRATNILGDSAYSNVAGPVTTPLVGPQNDIGVNFASGANGSTFALTSTDVAGVVPMSHWNNETGATGADPALIDSTGAPAAAGVSWQANTTWDAATQEDKTDMFPNPSGDDTLMAGYLDNFGGTAPADTGSFSAGSVDGNGVLFTGLGASAYDVYVYSLPSKLADNGVPRGGSITVTGASATTMGPIVAANSTSYVAGNNYLLFSGVQVGPGGDLLIMPDGTSFRDPIQGVELVPIAVQNVINDATGGNTITLQQDATNHAQIDWTMGAQNGKVPITDPNGLTINDSAAADTLVFDSSNGDPLPNLLKLNGKFNTSTVPPLGTGQKIDLEGSTVQINYPAGNSVLPAVQSALKGGQIFSSTLTGKLAISDTDTGSAIVLKPALPGDTNLSGKVDFTDLVNLARNYGKSGADWAKGDFNYDGKVDFSDLVALARNYGQASPATTAAVLNFAAALSPAVSTDVSGSSQKQTRKPLSRRLK